MAPLQIDPEDEYAAAVAPRRKRARLRTAARSGERGAANAAAAVQATACRGAAGSATARCTSGNQRSAAAPDDDGAHGASAAAAQSRWQLPGALAAQPASAAVKRPRSPKQRQLDVNTSDSADCGASSNDESSEAAELDRRSTAAIQAPQRPTMTAMQVKARSAAAMRCQPGAVCASQRSSLQSSHPPRRGSMAAH